jgi:pilus assembly protein Flp/PilA
MFDKMFITLQILQGRFVDAFEHDEEGATAVEYGLLVALIAAVIVVTVATLGTRINAAFQTVLNNMPGGAAT